MSQRSSGPAGRGSGGPDRAERQCGQRDRDPGPGPVSRGPNRAVTAARSGKAQRTRSLPAVRERNIGGIPADSLASGGGGVRVLVVEDDRELAEAIGVGLRREQMAVDLAFDGDAGLERALIHGYDVVVLDRDLPRTHGDDVCAHLVRQGCRSRVLMLTAAATIEERVDGLGIGADDYLPKPFAFAELVARIRALFRRAQPALPPGLVRGELRLDPARREATRAGCRLPLSPKEFAVLELLLAARGAAVSTEELLERAW